jgi:glycosidase
MKTNLDIEATRTFERLFPRLEARFAPTKRKTPKGWEDFVQQLKTNFPSLFHLYYELYGREYDFFYHLEDLLNRLAESWIARPSEWKGLDQERTASPNWYQSQSMVAGVCYVDLFAGNLQGIRDQIPYFKELGLTYLHLMPLFKAPEGENDGGYAVSDYREVTPALGTIDELRALAIELRSAGISLALDLIFNHTSDEHEWAQAARASDIEAQKIYRIYPDRKIPDQYEETLREIFPEEHPGQFSQLDDGRWVWTTFHSYQWDLNYANPAVFNLMVSEMLFIANLGVEVIRLDAVAFIWKQMGTSCENLPEAHLLIRAFNSTARIAAPALLFKSEAIVHPDDVNAYISPQECQLSYNPLLMALIWESLATRKVALLQKSMAKRFMIHPDTAWVNYVRVHDDIGWTFADEDAAQLGINGFDHRRFLNHFYSGDFDGSFARGLPFQYNPENGDMRISGTGASLAGLEKALKEETDLEVDLAIRRILMIHSIILSIGGIPLIYLGDEIATLNDYSYRDNPAKTEDSRWVHRPRSNMDLYAKRDKKNSIEGQTFGGLCQLIQIRKNTPAFAGNGAFFQHLDNPHVFGYLREHDGEWVQVFTSFSEQRQTISLDQIRLPGNPDVLQDLIAGEQYPTKENIKLEPYQTLWLVIS